MRYPHHDLTNGRRAVLQDHPGGWYWDGIVWLTNSCAFIIQTDSKKAFMTLVIQTNRIEQGQDR